MGTTTTLLPKLFGTTGVLTHTPVQHHCKCPMTQELATDFCPHYYQTNQLRGSICFVRSFKKILHCLHSLISNFPSLQNPSLIKNSAATYQHIIAFSGNLLISKPQSFSNCHWNFISAEQSELLSTMWLLQMGSPPQNQTLKNIPEQTTQQVCQRIKKQHF